MIWVYLSPHFDDAALSCGGLVWEQAQSGEKVNIWTICAGKPPPGDLSTFAQELHNRWEMSQNAPDERRIEDIHSCRLLGASHRHFTIPDCVYRRHPLTGEHMYVTEQSLNGALNPGDYLLIQDLHKELQNSLLPSTVVVCPLALGNHVDHQLTRQAVEGVDRQLWYYADFPYVLRSETQIEEIERQGWMRHVHPISNAGLAAWQKSIAAHGSQISTFWQNVIEMRSEVSSYLNNSGGICLWSRPA